MRNINDTPVSQYVARGIGLSGQFTRTQGSATDGGT